MKGHSLVVDSLNSVEAILSMAERKMYRYSLCSKCITISNNGDLVGKFMLEGSKWIFVTHLGCKDAEEALT